MTQIHQWLTVLLAPAALAIMGWLAVTGNNMQLTLAQIGIKVDDHTREIEKLFELIQGQEGIAPFRRLTPH